ncbi:MAG: non-hydrolyzing UDP-N-acetylglucosamine 2-epimerase [Flavobacteriales bacterium]
MRSKLLFIFGTRPEAIKLAPLIKAFEKDETFEVMVCVTAQHRQMLDQVLQFFSITPHYDLDLMRPNQTLSSLTANAISALQPVMEEVKPDVVFVQGDTTTVLAGALSAFYVKAKVAHIEAGLRSSNIYSPYPEEMNRLLTTRLTQYHFAPTPLAAQNLREEGIGSAIYMVGNTVIDALKLALQIISEDERHYSSHFEGIDFSKRIVLVTCHRRESFGEPFLQICEAILHIAKTYADVEFVYPVHLNPNIKAVADATLLAPNIKLIAPLEYPYLVWLMNKSHIVLTDSGGIQEEAPSLGKPVLVMRDVTERTEGVDAGTALLVGTRKDNIIQHLKNLLDNESAYQAMSRAVNPYGEGDSCKQIVEIMTHVLKLPSL